MLKALDEICYIRYSIRMKIWIKYLLGTALGLVIALFIPITTESGTETLSFLTELAIRIGRFFLIPILFFGTTLAMTNLRLKGTLIKTWIFTLIAGIVATAIIVTFGTLSALVINFTRIPIIEENSLDVVSINIKDHILMLFPYNGIEGLFNGLYLLPVLVFSAFLAAGIASDPIRSKQTYSLFESLNRVSYLIIHFFIEFLSIGMIAISCTWFISFFDALETGAYTGLIILLSVDVVIVVCILLPLLLRFFIKKSNPFKVLYACIAPMTTALFSGDTNLSYMVSIRHIKESLGIKKDTGATSLPLLSVFVRSGSGLVIAVSLIAILKSYSSLEIAFLDVLWITAFSVISSFFLGGMPTGGAFVAITILCSMYGRGFESAYLLLKPIAFILCTFGTAIDIATQIFCTYFIAKKSKMVKEKSWEAYI